MLNPACACVQQFSPCYKWWGLEKGRILFGSHRKVVFIFTEKVVVNQNLLRQLVAK